MPLGDVSYQNAALDAVVDSWPASGAVYAFWTSNPQLEDTPADVEVDLSVAGLTNPAFDSTDWAAATGGGKSLSSALALGTSTAALDDVGAYWGVKDSTGLVVYSDDLADDAQIVVTDDDIGGSPTFDPGALSFGDA